MRLIEVHSTGCLSDAALVAVLLGSGVLDRFGKARTIHVLPCRNSVPVSRKLGLCLGQLLLFLGRFQIRPHLGYSFSAREG